MRESCRHAACPPTRIASPSSPPSAVGRPRRLPRRSPTWPRTSATGTITERPRSTRSTTTRRRRTPTADAAGAAGRPAPGREPLRAVRCTRAGRGEPAGQPRPGHAAAPRRRASQVAGRADRRPGRRSSSGCRPTTEYAQALRRVTGLLLGAAASRLPPAEPTEADLRDVYDALRGHRRGSSRGCRTSSSSRSCRRRHAVAAQRARRCATSCGAGVDQLRRQVNPRYRPLELAAAAASDRQQRRGRWSRRAARRRRRPADAGAGRTDRVLSRGRPDRPAGHLAPAAGRAAHRRRLGPGPRPPGARRPRTATQTAALRAAGRRRSPSIDAATRRRCSTRAGRARHGGLAGRPGRRRGPRPRARAAAGPRARPGRAGADVRLVGPARRPAARRGRGDGPAASPGGDPWKRQQTHQTLARYLLEEATRRTTRSTPATSTRCARSWATCCCRWCCTPGWPRSCPRTSAGSIDDVAGDLVEKMVRRNPHVFAGAEVGDVEEIIANWERIKQAEKARDSVAGRDRAGQPALALAAKILQRAERAGLDVPLPAGPPQPSPTTARRRLLAAGRRGRARRGLDAEAALRRAALAPTPTAVRAGREAVPTRTRRRSARLTADVRAMPEFVPLAERIVDALLAADPGAGLRAPATTASTTGCPTCRRTRSPTGWPCCATPPTHCPAWTPTTSTRQERVDHDSCCPLVERGAVRADRGARARVEPAGAQPGRRCCTRCSPGRSRRPRSGWQRSAGRLAAMPDALATARAVLRDVPADPPGDRGRPVRRHGRADPRRGAGAAAPRRPALRSTVEPAAADAVGRAGRVRRLAARRRGRRGEPGRDPRLGRRLWEAKLWHTLDTELTAAEVLRPAPGEPRPGHRARSARRPPSWSAARPTTTRCARRSTGSPTSTPTTHSIVDAGQGDDGRDDRVRPRARPGVPRRRPVRDPGDAGVRPRAWRSPTATRRARWRPPTCRRSTASRRRRPTGRPERVESFYREYNDHMMRNLTVHEAMPGHFLQLAHSRRYRGRTRVRALGSVRPVRRGLGGLRRGADGRAAASAACRCGCSSSRCSSG